MLSLKAKELYEINGHAVRLTWLPDTPDHTTHHARAQCAVAESLCTPPADTMRQLVNVLNDDCIRHILVARHLNVLDLCEVADTCTRLRALAIEAFAARYRQCSDHLAEVADWCFQHIERYFRLFGAVFKVFDARNFYASSPILPPIMAHCTELKELRCSLHDDRTMYEMRPLFSRLQSLTLRECSVTFDLSLLFDANAPIQSLALEGCPYVHLSPRALPNLVELKLHTVQLRSPTSDDQTAHFFQQNAQLLRLELEYVQLDNSCLSTVLWPLVNLEELTCYVYGCDTVKQYRGFESLRRLKALRLSAGADDERGILSALLEAQAPLASLHLDQWASSADAGVPVDLLCRFVRMKHLHIRRRTHSFRTRHVGDLDDQQLLQLVRELPELEHICVESPAIRLSDIDELLECGQRLQTMRVTMSPDQLPTTVDPARRWLRRISKAVQRRCVRLEIHVLLEVEVSAMVW